MAMRSSEEVRASIGPGEQAECFDGANTEDEDCIDDHEVEEECDESSDWQSSHDEESECEQPSKAASQPDRKRSIIRGKNGYEWSTEAAVMQGRSSKTVAHSPGPIGGAINIRKPIDAWSVLFTDEMLRSVVRRTNEEISRRCVKRKDSTFNGKTNLIEIKAFIGLLYLAGVRKQSHTDVANLWSLEFGQNFFACVMSEKRFRFLGSYLRFDDKKTRVERRAADGLAPVRNLWEKFMKECRNNYNMSNNATIGRQLLAFRGNFCAKVRINSKPPRYGIKIISLNDASTHYMYNAIPYIGEVTLDRNEKIPEYYVRVLCESIFHTYRTVTFDNWFTTIDICDKMHNQYGLNAIGTIRKNKPEIPTSFKRSNSVGTKRYAHNNEKNITLVSYCPKRNKVVLLVSTLNGKFIAPSSGKPDIIDYYKLTKDGVDTFEEMIKFYSCSRTTTRWPMRFFFGILDQAAVNAVILHNFLPQNNALHRSDFLNKLSLALVWQHLEHRANITTLRNYIKCNIFLILGKSDAHARGNDKMERRKRCHFCPTKSDKKTIYCCYKCQKPTCEQHRITCCRDCA